MSRSDRYDLWGLSGEEQQVLIARVILRLVKSACARVPFYAKRAQ
jgi:ribosomal protein L25 (general stress protein Ctc)